jgi:hypothetical protein
MPWATRERESHAFLARLPSMSVGETHAHAHFGGIPIGTNRVVGDWRTPSASRPDSKNAK